MKTLLLALISLLLFASSTILFSAQPTAAGAQPQKPPAKSSFNEIMLNPDEVTSKCEEMKQKMLTGKFKLDDVLSYSQTYKQFGGHPKIEIATKIYRDWYLKMSRVLEAMSKSMYVVNYAEHGDPIKDEDLKKAKAQIKELFETYKKLAMNPSKMSGKK